MSLIVLGTVALDSIKTPFGIRENVLGGSAVHFAMSARLFTKVNLVAVVGNDFPQRYINFLKHRGINLDSLTKVKGKTFKWKGRYTEDLNTVFTLNTELGVLESFNPQLSDRQRNIKYIFLANVDPDIQRNLLEKMRYPKLVGLDSMNFWIKHKRSSLVRLLKQVDIFMANEQEARSLSSENDLLRVAKRLSGFGPKIVLIKRGENGVSFFSKNSIFSLPAYPTAKVIDPTGAGDTFAGGFMGYLAKIKRLDGSSIKNALAYGTVAASFNVEDFGLIKTSKLKIKDLALRLKEFRNALFVGDRKLVASREVYF